MNDEKKFTASVVGGGSGGNLSIKALMNSSRFKLKAVADLNPAVCKKIKESYPDVKTFTNYSKMFNECPTNIVCVSTFPSSHEQITLDALNALPLKGILVEKPLGILLFPVENFLKRLKNGIFPWLSRMECFSKSPQWK